MFKASKAEKTIRIKIPIKLKVLGEHAVMNMATISAFLVFNAKCAPRAITSCLNFSRQRSCITRNPEPSLPRICEGWQGKCHCTIFVLGRLSSSPYLLVPSTRVKLEFVKEFLDWPRSRMEVLLKIVYNI